VQPWTPAVHALLNYLEDADFPYSPRVIGIANQCELRRLLGTIATQEGLRAAAHILREYHRAVAAWTPEENPVWFTGQVGTGGAGQIRLQSCVDWTRQNWQLFQ
jgi:hypothetical protein